MKKYTFITTRNYSVSTTATTLQQAILAVMEPRAPLHYMPSNAILAIEEREV